MNAFAIFIHRPIATTLLTLGIVLAGMMAYFNLPVAPLPQVDFPTLSVQASLPGASPETMAATVATPLERTLGRIAGVTEITSSSSLGSTRVVLQFDLDRDIDGAARDVQAAIQASRALLPSGLPSMPTYRKLNPADAPIMILSLTSGTLTPGQMYDAASTVLAQRLSQIDGIGQVNIGGGALPAVRVELNPTALNHSGLSLDKVRAAIVASNAYRPLGTLEDGGRHWQLGSSDQGRTAADFKPLILSYVNGAPLRLQDVADVHDSVQDVRHFGAANSRPAVLLILYRQPGANIIQTVDSVRALLPRLRAVIPAAIDLDVVMDRTPTIRGSLREVQRTLAIAVGLVILVVFLFLRRARAAMIPTVAVPVSLIGTCGVMYLAGYSIDNLSLMALTVATGFVVDDAIVVTENITRHLESGMKPFAAALAGVREIGFTVVSISLSLVAVFIPILFMGGIVGRLFREFAVTLSAAILVSMVVSLTATPMLCAHWLKAPPPDTAPGPWARWNARLLRRLKRGYRASLAWSLRHSALMLALLGLTVALNVHLYTAISKGFFPTQDTGRIMGGVKADQSISFTAMRQKMLDLMRIVQRDPAVDTVVGFTGGGQTNSGFMFVTLKPLGTGRPSADKVVARLRGKLAHEPGASLILNPAQDVRIGGRQSDATYQYTLQADRLTDLRAWEPRVRRALMDLPELTDVNSDQQNKGLQTRLVFDRDRMASLGLTMSAVDSTLNSAFGQRQVSVIYNPLNQYRVVMELAPAWLTSPESLRSIWFSTPGGGQVALSDIARLETANAPLAINHQGTFPASTLSFNLPPGVSLGAASAAIDRTLASIGAPTSVHGGFQGTARAFQDSLSSQPILILTALLTVYIVLGILYESLIHPITILSTLPSAGVGALLALMAFGNEFNVIALIGVILLIGIVKKNAILMIDFAIHRQRRHGVSAARAIYRAAQMRFRPIMMTTLAATFGAVPLALGSGDGAELRNPLGIAIVGGLLVSQLLTLYTTPVVYLLMDRLRNLVMRRAAPTVPAMYPA
ncbi:MAG: multidrug transporter subunit MdtC [Thiobacillus sp. 63-78]|uniref:multidrug efflux RND transporter permease subunit n=1 Tax=Thiobacillus sp. 63-78 TaxID=1895859 RepID=UPI00096749BB|nr:multidrug efflux RND transporter permease subunit [Thiobacillus sp. 63-78]MBN8762687.1 multidrug efflux RND transporter permease subunit [Thiobacillus sp.]MBN8774102.1 multidrug efflux RND transporter permease subunit [Thiobacillus sp.]OJZ16939.1 MAG: multidrug transporter subunit MdtC [Thiobacillus sp. 63-78]